MIFAAALSSLRRACARFYMFLTSPLRRKPNLFILGFHKCGTTYLADLLRSHACMDGPNWLAQNGDKETYAFHAVEAELDARARLLQLLLRVRPPRL